MAKFYPDFEIIKNSKVSPTEGELYLLNFLKENYNDEYEVYFNPYMNGDRPDVIIMRRGGGVFIIEVKDWELNSYELNDRKQWKIKYNNAITKSPIQQILKYKENLYELHIPNLLEKKIKDIRNFNIVCCAVYFHNATQNDLQDFLVAPFEKDIKYQTFLKYNIELIGRNDLEKEKFDKILEKRYIKTQYPSALFTKDLYESFSRFFNPALHLKEEGKSIIYSEEQQRIIYSQNKIHRIKGVVGSGKTTILVARAVEIYKRILKENHHPKILILTYNVTLKNYIRDKLNQIPENFEWKSFDILNYHLLINSVLNNIGIDFHIGDDFQNEAVSNYFERKYYSNVKLFEENKDKIKKYDAILIDEIQDYKREWFNIIKKYILKQNGEYVLFGDVKQNIYGRVTENKDVAVPEVKGRPNELKRCYRSEQKVKELAVAFQKEFYKDKYEIDDFDNKEISQLTIDFERNLEGCVNYMCLENTVNFSALYNIIHQSLENKFKTLSINDVAVLGFTIQTLKEFEAYYRYHSREKTNTMFETKEVSYKILLETQKGKITIYEKGEELLKNYYPFKNRIIHLSKLLTIYELYEKYNDEFHQFNIALENECKKTKISLDDFLNFINENKEEYRKLKEQSHQSFETIRKNKKMNFWFNSGTIKISTVHSFKGWESELVFLILEPKYGENGLGSYSFDEVLYTGITRSRSNLVIINFGNYQYDSRLKELVEKIK